MDLVINKHGLDGASRSPKSCMEMSETAQPKITEWNNSHLAHLLHSIELGCEAIRLLLLYWGTRHPARSRSDELWAREHLTAMCPSRLGARSRCWHPIVKLFDTSLALLYCRSQHPTTKATIRSWIALSELGYLPRAGPRPRACVMSCSVRGLSAKVEPAGAHDQQHRAIVTWRRTLRPSLGVHHEGERSMRS